MSADHLHVPVIAPQGALLDHAARALSELNAKTGGSWFDAARPDADPTQWTDRSAAGRLARAHSRAAPAPFDEADGRPALILTAGENGGFRVEKAIDSPIWSAAILWHPAPEGEETRSLLAARGARGENYLYLAQGEDLATEFRDNQNVAIARLPGAGRGWQALVLSRAHDRLRLWRPGDDAMAEASGAADLADGADLLIGARSHRPGMAKTLGSAAIGGVLLWPGHDLLADRPDPAAQALRDGFAHFCLWEL